MPLTPVPIPSETGAGRIEACGSPAPSFGNRHAPGAVEFDVFLEGSNRIARETDTFRLGESSNDERGPSKRPTTLSATPRKNGWAWLGEVLTGRRASSPQSVPPPSPQTVVQRHAGTGRMIDVIA